MVPSGMLSLHVLIYNARAEIAIPWYVEIVKSVENVNIVNEGCSYLVRAKGPSGVRHSEMEKTFSVVNFAPERGLALTLDIFLWHGTEGIEQRA